MKKLIYGGLFLATVGIGLIGCKKESLPISEINISEISSDGKLLIFNSVEGFERNVDEQNVESREHLLSKISSQNYKNYFSVDHPELKNGESSQEMDDFFGQLLNEDGAIQIGNHIFKIDLGTDQVFVIKSENKESDYDDLINGNTNNKNVAVYSVDQEVLYLVNGEAEEKCGGIGGFDNYSNVVNLDDVGNIKFDANCRLFRAGVYFRVTGRVEYTQAYSGQVKIALEIQGPQAWMRRRPCGSGTITTQHSGERVSGYFYRYLFEAYSKTRNLNGIYMFVRARAEITPPGQPTVTKYTNWNAGRNVNSPY